MGIELKQFAGHTITAQDDAILNDQLSADSGIITGCSLNFVSVNVVTVSDGWGIIKGRLFKVTDTTLNCRLPAGEGVGIIKVRMDLSNAVMPIEITSAAAEGETYPELEQDENCNFTSGIYEMELGRYTATSIAISQLEQTFDVLKNTLDSKITQIIQEKNVLKVVSWDPASGQLVTTMDAE